MKTIREQSARELILNFRQFEFATTMRVLKAYPEDKLDMKPAEKSRSARQLITTFISEEYVCRAVMQGHAPYSDIPRSWPDDLAELLDIFNQVHDEAQGMIAQADDEELDRVVDFNGFQVRALDVLWIELHDQIHHRGQFSVYLRLAGARVPSIYGPTADEPLKKQS
ncbi:MAG: DinB family protein [Blastocatellia bacterium]|nr:DinB family protein [Blastocatellia bacterium]